MKQIWTSFCRISDNDLTKQNGHMKLSTKCNPLPYSEQRALQKFYVYLLICGVTQNVFVYISEMFQYFSLILKPICHGASLSFSHSLPKDNLWTGYQ